MKALDQRFLLTNRSEYILNNFSIINEKKKNS